MKYYLVIFLSFAFNLSYGQSVDFTFSTSNNLFCNPQTVTFTQNCTGGPESLIWDFGNGQIGTGAVENITYLTAGTYNVTLTAAFSNSAISVTKQVIINATPTISVTVDRPYLCQPGVINFTATGSANISSYEWDFGDGSGISTTTTNTTSHNFASYNNFTVTVKGITAAGCSATSSINVQVSRFAINASISPTSGCIPSVTSWVANTTLPIGDAPASFVWTFGDASPNATTNVNNTTHIYNITTPITTATVSISTVQGCTNQFSFPTIAFGTPPFNTALTTISGRDTFCGSETIGFSCASTNANQYTWDFGDGTTQSTTSDTVTHKYLTLGDKQIIVTPFFNGCAGTRDTINIYVTGVIALYSFGNQCATKNTFSFVNNSLGTISKYYWTFTDAPTMKDSVNYNITHTFPTNGTFQTKLFLLDGASGCSDSLITTQYTATPSLVSASSRVCKDSLLTYTVLSTYNAASGYIYDFYVNNTLHTTTSNLININAINFGSTNDFVVIRNPVGNTCNDTIYKANPTVVSGPSVSFNTVLQQCLINSFPLTNTSFPFYPNDSIMQWSWSFGDNSRDSIRNPQPKRYTAAGNYTITLLARDTNNCRQSFSQNVTVFPMPYIKSLPSIDTICFGQSTNLFAFTTDTLLWVPATNISCTTCDTTLVNPQFTTQYIAEARNSLGCVSRDTSLVKVYRPINLSITPVDTFVCPGSTVQLQTSDSGITVWSPSIYLSSTTISNPISRPDTTTVYTVVVRDSVGCYADTALVRVNTFPRPTVNAGPDLVLPFNSNFTLNPVYSNNIGIYDWSPGTNSLSCLNCPSPVGVANFTETYTIDITSVNGCKATDQITVYVACSGSNLYVPTAFTPNNDGKNDLFYPQTRGFSNIDLLQVYNRWGQKVFERKNFKPNISNLGWDGKAGNVNITLDNDAYVWYIEATCDLGEKVKKKGTVILVK
jgi:gliding motility-associated-like protein